MAVTVLVIRANTNNEMATQYCSALPDRGTRVLVLSRQTLLAGGFEHHLSAVACRRHQLLAMALPRCGAPAYVRVVDGAATLPRAVCSYPHFCGDAVSDSRIFECFLFPDFVRSRSFSISGVRANIRICCRRHYKRPRKGAAFPSTYRLRVCWPLVVDDGGFELGAKSRLPRQ